MSEVVERAVLRDGTALSTSAVLTGLVGLVCWLLAAAALPQAEVGASAAFVSGFILIAGIAQLNAGLAMLRWLPRAGRRSGTLILRGYAIVASTAAIAATVFLMLPAGAVATAVGGPVLFVVASVCWALFQLQDSVLAALDRAWWVPLCNGIYGVVRVATVPMAGTALALLVTWIAPTTAVMLAVGLVLAVLASRRRGAGELPAGREVLRFLGPAYLATLGTTVLYNAVPLLVVHQHGTVLGATFFVVWTGLAAADYAVQGFVNSLVLRGSGDAWARARNLVLVARRLALLAGPAVAAGIVLAPVALGMFGASYAEQGSTALRIVLVGLIVRLSTVLAVGARLADGDSKGAAVIQLSSTGLVLLGVVSTPVGGLAGPATGFLLAQSLVAAAVLPGLIRRLR